MSKIILDIPEETHEKLKALAKDDDRSLVKYIIHGLEYLVNMPVPYHKKIKIIKENKNASKTKHTRQYI